MELSFEKYFIGDSLELNWDYIDTIPEFIELKNCEQNPKWHSEGNAYQHTKKCIQAAYILLTNGRYSYEIDEARTMIISVLFHDIGKITTTEFRKGAWHSYGHEIAGEKIARLILWDEPFFYNREKVCSLIRYHMDVLKIAENKDCYQKMVQISYEPYINWQDLLFVKICDIMGSMPSNFEEQREIDLNKINFLEKAAKAMNIYYGINVAYNRDKTFNRPCSFKKENNIPIINLIIGLPGAGKNTLINGQFKDCVVISRDDIRAELGYCGVEDKIVGTEEQENKVSEIFNNRLKNAVSKGKNVVINNINLKKKYRDEYKHLIGNTEVKWAYFYVEAPSLEDNCKRRTMISKTVFFNMIKNFDWPRCDEYDTFREFKQSDFEK